MKRWGWLILVLIIISGLKITVRAGIISNNSTQCSDLVMLFARGSSSNPQNLYLDSPFRPDTFGEQEEIPGAFFRWMETRIKADYKHIDYKAISIHNSAKGWSIQGYPAVGIFGGSTINNMFDAELAWWPAGEYRGSVDSGAHELAGQVNYEVERCPSQRIVIGGYSQGAHVVHEALKIIPENQRNIIDNVVMFGDPKFIGADYNKYNLLDKPKAYPWHRGTAGLRERGLADAEIPYVPEDMKYKTISWCHEDDFVCTGMSGLSWALTNHELPGNDNSIWKSPEAALGDGHTRYPEFGVPEATEEVLANLKPYLSALEVSRGGLDPNTDPYRKSYDGTLTNNRPIDLMFAFNKTGGIDDAFFQYSFNLKNIINQYKNNFTNITTGSVMYTDMAGGTNNPYQGYISAYTQKPNQLSTNTNSMFAWDPYIYGGLGGGGDYPENHGMVIERAGMFASWRAEATKHIVIFAERPALENWSFNACDSFVQSQFPLSIPTRCTSGAKFNTSGQSVYCENVLVIVSSSECAYAGATTQTRIVSRNLIDEVNLARSKGFVVDIIQPHTARTGQQAWAPESVEMQLKNLAESTGGLYLKYGVFDEPALRDAIWQILNHQPQLMNLKQYLPGTNLNFLEAKDTSLPQLLTMPLPSGTTVQVITTPVPGARSYSWDTDGSGTFEEHTQGPVLLASAPDINTGFIKVTAHSGSTQQSPIISMATIPFQVVGAPSGVPYIPQQVTGLEGLDARRRSDGKVSVNWGTASLGNIDIILIKDPVTGMPGSSTQGNTGGLVVDQPESDGQFLYLQLITGGGEAGVQTVLISPYVPPVTNIQNPETPTIQDPFNPQDQDNMDIPTVVDQPSDDPTPDLIVGSLDDPEKAPNNTGDVGLTDDKVVTQDEPNSTQDPNSPSNKPPVQVPVVNASTSPQPTTPSLSSTPQVTAVAGIQDVQSNPQGEVGGVEAANELFKDEEIGKQTNPAEQEQINWLLIVGMGTGALCLVLLGIFVLKRKDEEE